MRSRIVVNADDLGLSAGSNAGILEGARGGVLTSTSLMLNGGAIDHALNEVLPRCPQLGIGVHLNIVEGRSTRRVLPRASRLYGADGELRLRFTDLLARQRDAALLSAIEGEMRDQIERGLARLDQLDHLDSHQHAHMVPAIFGIVCRLALEYGIPVVRLSREHPHSVPGTGAQYTTWYPLNLVKRAVLNRLAASNVQTACQLGVRTNDFLVGITFSGYMSAEAITSGVGAAVDAGGRLLEVLVHPCRVSDDTSEHYISKVTQEYVRHPSRIRETELLNDPLLGPALTGAGGTLTCYGCDATGAWHAASHVGARGRGVAPLAAGRRAAPEGIA